MRSYIQYIVKSLVDEMRREGTDGKEQAFAIWTGAGSRGRAAPHAPPLVASTAGDGSYQFVL